MSGKRVDKGRRSCSLRGQEQRATAACEAFLTALEAAGLSPANVCSECLGMAIAIAVSHPGSSKESFLELVGKCWDTVQEAHWRARRAQGGVS